MTTLFPLRDVNFSEKTRPRELPEAKNSENLSLAGVSSAITEAAIIPLNIRKKAIFFIRFPQLVLRT
jgi:hypothetical protein